MGRKSREKRERREGQVEEAKCSGTGPGTDRQAPDRIAELEERLRNLGGGDAEFWASPNLAPETRQSDLEDIVAFESVEEGTSLFDGLQEHGLKLPPPEELDEKQSSEKAMAVLRELARLRIMLVGFEDMTAREFYSTLWNQTLWEGCYMKKRNPGAFTIIDVSHRSTRAEILRSLEDLKRACTVH